LLLDFCWDYFARIKTGTLPLVLKDEGLQHLPFSFAEAFVLLSHFMKFAATYLKVAE